MAIPDRPTDETQVWPGHAAIPAYETPMYKIGRKGLNLVDAIDDLDAQEFSRMLNLVSRYGSPPTIRPGETALGTTAGVERIHSLFRLNDPAAGSFARFAGSATNLYRGTSGAFTSVDSGYSGDPLTFCAVNLPLTGAPYVFVSDRSRMRKIARTGAVEAIGQVAGLLTSTALGTQLTTMIAEFDAGDGTQAASWTLTAGTDEAGNATAAPTATDTGAGTTVAFTTNPAGAAANTGYYSVASIAKAVDGSVFPGPVNVEDDDLLAFDALIDRPDWVLEFRIYLVISAFTAGIIPGADTTQNTDAWWKSFTAADITDFIEIPGSPTSPTESSTTLREQNLLQAFKDEATIEDSRPGVVNTGVLGYRQLSRTVNPQIAPGRSGLTRFGITGQPLRRSEFARLGADTSKDWSDITGIVIVLRTNTNQVVNFTFNILRLIGGSGPDTSDIGRKSYDYRVVNYHPIEGTLGNPSAIQAEANWLDPVRQPVTITPTATGNAALRQRAYRRGGGAATTINWFFVGQNSADGGTITDVSSDSEIAAEETLEIDNDQPVTSVDASGATVLNKTVPIFFLVEDYAFALGDTNQPGRLYRSKQGFLENWPADEFTDVCAASEELMNGGMIGSSGFVFSRTRMYAILLNSDGTWTTEPTSCNEGLIGRWAMAITPFGVAFVSPFGVRLTSGGVPDRLSDEMIGPLFRGETVRGMFPIDFTVPTALQLAYYQDELWLSYQDSAGTRRQLIFNFFDKAWRPYLFGTPVATVYGEPVQGAAPSILLGANAAGAIYTHAGFSDLGSGIAYSFRTGATDYGDPRVEKLLSEIIVDAEIQTTTLTLQAYLNDELTAVTAQSVVGIAGLRRYSFEPFGTLPQHARNVAVDASGTAPTAATLYFNQMGVSRQQQPEITINQPSPWEELPGGEGYVWGVLITCDTGNAARSVLVEYTDNNGAITTAATLSVTADGRKKLPFSFAAVLAQQIRLRPTGSCLPWIRWKIEWLSDPEPPRLAGWDSNWLNLGTYADKWLKGYLIEADTFNVAKTVVVDIDQALVQDTRALTFNGRGIQHISFAKLRGRLFRLRSTDANFGKFYRWQPIFDEEPLALTRWQTEERPHEGLEGRWQKPLEAFISIRSSGTVTLQITSVGHAGTLSVVSTYTLATTGGAKQKIRLPLNATKGMLFEYLFTAAAGFWLYKEESEILVEDWSSGAARWCPLPASNDDLDPSRQMGNAAVAAATPGGA